MDHPLFRPFRSQRQWARLTSAACLGLFLVLALAPVRSQAETATRVVTDSLGRQITVPAEIRRVISTYPPVTTIVYMLAPDKLVGWNFKPDKRNMPPKYAALPVVGGWFGVWSGNYETMINMKPDVILYDTIFDDPGGESMEAVTERQRKFGSIPVVGIFGSALLSSLDDRIRFIGDLLGAGDRAEELIRLHRESTEKVTERVAGIPPEERVRVYYAERPDGLSTDPAGSRHSALISLCGGINVAKCPMKQGMGLTKVSIEQILKWNPQVIITEKRQILKAIRTDPTWAGIEAVRKNRVYLTPRGPFCWFDRPPGASTIPGILWTAVKLYPDRFRDVDLRELARTFYETFYHYRISETELDQLLGPSSGAGG